MNASTPWCQTVNNLGAFVIPLTHTPPVGGRSFSLPSTFVVFVAADVPQEGGADVIELGVPFTDPQADGATIQHTNQARVWPVVVMSMPHDSVIYEAAIAYDS